jgi:uncharacterized protein (DUF305 family)
MKHSHYGRLAAMAALSFVSMYVLMYAMVDSAGDAYNNLNQAYMAGLMAAPMVVIELVLMAGMYRNRRLNALLIVVSVVAALVCFGLIRRQVAISDQQFLRSMIPHHSGAILMCEEASIQNPKVRALCRTIISGQQAEINQMRAMLQSQE